MPKSKKTPTTEHHIKQEKEKYGVKNTIHWKEIIRIIGIFLISFVICSFSTKYLFIWLLNRPKQNEFPKVTSSFTASFSKTIKTISSLFPRAQYDYFQTKRQFIDPVLVKKILDDKDSSTLLVDIRSMQEYKSAHIKMAINAPSYTDSKNVYGSLTQKNTIRAEIDKHMKGKRLVVIYGYRPDVDITQDSYENLKQTFPVRVLDVSWNDWRNNFYSWLPNAEKQNFVINTYIEGTDVSQTVGLPHL